MTKQQIGGIVVVLAVVLLVVAVVNRRSNDQIPGNPTSNNNTNSRTEQATPETLDAVTASVVAQGVEDAGILDAETAEALQGVDADSESVNNLGTAYDENSF